MNILKCLDKDGVPVVCSKETWNKHILPKHDEVEGCEAHVQSVIQHPRNIYQDTTNLNKLLLYSPAVLPKAHHCRYLRVVVHYKNHKILGRRGYVESAMGCWNIRQGDLLIWESK